MNVNRVTRKCFLIWYQNKILHIFSLSLSNFRKNTTSQNAHMHMIDVYQKCQSFLF